MVKTSRMNRCAGAAALQALALLAGAALLSAPAKAEKPEPMGNPGVAFPLIGAISITSNNIFDPDEPEEDRALYRLANKLHVRTRPEVIRQQLLFDVGDTYSPQAVAESERILRSNRYIQTVSVRPRPREDGTVDVDVTTSDVWTLMPKIAYSRSGGTSNSAVGLKEMNLLGTGTAVEVQYSSDVDRDSTLLKLSDRNLGQSWYGLAALFARNSDGHEYGLKFGKPFYSLNSTSAQSVSVHDRDRVESLYVRGDLATEYRLESQGFEFWFGRSKGLRDGWARRLTVGAAVDDERYSSLDTTLPTLDPLLEDRRLIYPFVGIEIIEDHYDKSRNYDQIHRVEDRFLGTRLSARVGLARHEFGSDRNAWLINAQAQRGFGGEGRSTLLLATDMDARLERDGAQNMRVGVSAKYYKRQSERRLLYVGLSGTYGHNLDLEQFLPLGGDTGMRGYPLRFQSGDKRAVLSVEQRIFTDWYPFRLFRVGAAAFADVGRAWGDSPLGEGGNALLSDVGFGLRLGSTRSGLGRMIHIDVAFPLAGQQDIDGVQFLVSTRKSF